MIGVGGHRASGAAVRLWRVAALTAAGAIGSASHAEAALYYWSDSYPGYSQPGPMVPQRRPKARHPAKNLAAPEKESSKPQGPLIIAISIEKQKLRVYDANGFFAETPISTGMKGHPTPMGVFSIIQKHKFHHSNIYSGAPMPYMQRITWSGVAMHAGVLPGYPASHGCIRMPMAFAMKMWNWTRMGARVVVTPGDVTPASFSHPLLVAQKVVPQPTAANEPQADAPPAAKADKAADAATPAIAEASLELRSSVGHGDRAKPIMDEPSAATPLREQTHTADASVHFPAIKDSVMSDAAPSRANAAAPAAVSAADGDAAKDAEAVASNAAEPAAKPDEAASSDDKAVETKSSETATAEAQAPVQASGEAAKVETSATGSVTAEAKTEETKVEAKADEVKAEALTPEAPRSAEKPGESIKAVTEIGAGVAVKKEQARLPDNDKATASKPDPATLAAPKRSGQISVFVSRKDSKLYARQNFAPLFEAPITIAPSDRPLGTHVFTAQIDKNDANVLHWSVVSLPAASRRAERYDEDERVSRRRKIAGVVEIKAMPVPDSPTEALDRLTIPADAMARITEALSTGSSIIVSDQGIGSGETGEGTDFIVSLR
jgi:lipoprotein-anchoring transpeptidase ErfK/SrfK